VLYGETNGRIHGRSYFALQSGRSEFYGIVKCHGWRWDVRFGVLINHIPRLLRARMSKCTDCQA